MTGAEAGLRRSVEWVRAHYRRLGLPMPAHVQAALAPQRRGGRGPRPAAPEVRYRATEEELRFELPFTYPSRNEIEHMNRHQKAALKGRWVADVRKWLMVYERRAPGRFRAYRSRVRITAILHLPDPGRRRDLDNYSYKWLKDALQGFLLVDDSVRYVEDGLPVFADLAGRPEPWMEIIITPIGPIGAASRGERDGQKGR
ncbi:MAG: hypothetical protein ACM3X6_01385 [Patescibacteria group bacterium]